jgi:hypothetical protein
MAKFNQRQTKLDSFLGIASKKELKQSTLPFCFKPKPISDPNEKIENQTNSKFKSHDDKVSTIENKIPLEVNIDKQTLEDERDNDNDDDNDKGKDFFEKPTNNKITKGFRKIIDDDEDIIVDSTRKKNAKYNRRIYNRRIIDDDDDDDEEEIMIKSKRMRIAKGKRRVIDDDDDEEEENIILAFTGKKFAKGKGRIIDDDDDVNESHKVTTASSESLKQAGAMERKTIDDLSQNKNFNRSNNVERKVESDFHQAARQANGDVGCYGDEKKVDGTEKCKPSTISSTAKVYKNDSVKVQDETSVGAPIKEESTALKDVSTQFTDQPLLYLVVCETLERIEAISSRLEIQAILTDLFRHVRFSSSPKDLYDLVYLCSNSVAPSYACLELGIGDAILIRAIGEAYGTKPCKSNI